MSFSAQIVANTSHIRELEAAIAEFQVRCRQRDEENARLIADLEALGTQLSAAWELASYKGPISAEQFDGVEAITRRARASEQAAEDRVQSSHISEDDEVERTPDIDFSGTWGLVESIGFKEYLEATGVPWAKRQLAATFKPVQEWARNERGWEFTMQTPIGAKVEALPLGETVPDEIDGNAVLKESYWEGAELVTRCTPQDPARREANTTFFRRRYDAIQDRLVLEIVTGPARCTRIFARQR
mmetsp:Transcript_11189/g.38105  ORF Transcript_11189/g.38105 Transcript_11189/m.38105 type:complete len:243 (-) Transcript_11189:372-1100(-)